MFERHETALPGVLLLAPKLWRDDRGFLFESYHQQKFEELGIRERFVQDNHSRSRHGVLRGLHFQLRHPQAKLCRVVQGEVLDVVVDIRHGSPTFGKWLSVVLSEENRRQLFIPSGFAHGFAVLSDTADFLYKCSDFYHPEDDRGLLWADPDLGIDWPAGLDWDLSLKDSRNPRLAELRPEDLPCYRPEAH